MRQVFVSDLHLGSVFTKTGLVRDFLAANADKNTDLFLLGDIFDLWKTDPNPNVFPYFSGYRSIYYLPGNHDDELMCARILSPLVVRSALITKNGKQLLITHGDMFDPKYGKDSFWNRVCDGFLYRLSRLVNYDVRSWLNPLKRKFYSSLEGYRKTVLGHLKEHEVNTIIFGHTHVPERTEIDGKLLINLGSWDGRPFTVVSEGDKYAYFEVTSRHLAPEKEDFNFFW